MGVITRIAGDLDRKIINRTMNLARQLRRIKIPVTTFMVTQDPWLQKFVQDFTEVNNGKGLLYTGLKGLGRVYIRRL